MATKTAKAATKTSMNQGQKIKSRYMEYRLDHGTPPPSIYAFAKELKIKEEDFYNYYNSFDGIEQDIWNGYMTQTLDKLYADEIYAQYSVHEKLLALYYTLFEVLKSNRSFIILSYNQRNKKQVVPQFLHGFRKSFTDFIQELVDEGLESGAIAARPGSLQNNYHRGAWAQYVFLLDFWINDNSQSFQDTDAAVEKSVNLFFDLIGNNIIDNAFDFAKFLIGRRTWI